MAFGLPPILPDDEERDPYLAELEALQSEDFQPGQFRGSFLEPFAGLQQQQFPQPRGFGEGFLYGLTGGLGRSGSAAAQKRQQFEESEGRRRAQFDLERREATRTLRTLSGQERRARIKERVAAQKEQEKLDREEPTVDAALIAKHPDVPWLTRFQGQRVPRKWLEPESPAEKARADRAARTEARLMDSSRRSEQAADRQERIAAINSYDKLAENYKADPAIKGYNDIRSNLVSAETAAKQATGPADIAIIFSYMRALEPGNVNVVREGDVRLAREAVNLTQRIRNLPDRFFRGTMLTPEGRQFFLRQMRDALKSRRGDFDMANEQFRDAAQTFGVPERLFIRDYAEPGAAQSRVRPSNVRPAPAPTGADLDAEYEQYLRLSGGR